MFCFVLLFFSLSFWSWYSFLLLMFENVNITCVVWVSRFILLDSMGFLNLDIYVILQVRNYFSHYSFKYIFCSFLSFLLCFRSLQYKTCSSWCCPVSPLKAIFPLFYSFSLLLLWMNSSALYSSSLSLFSALSSLMLNPST